MGVFIFKLDLVKVVFVRLLEGRIFFLEIIYFDDDLRIGRGGEGSLFVLLKVFEVIL